MTHPSVNSIVERLIAFGYSLANDDADLIDEAATIISELQAERDVLKHGTHTAYVAMKKAIGLCQIDLKNDDWLNENEERRSLRLGALAGGDASRRAEAIAIFRSHLREGVFHHDPYFEFMSEIDSPCPCWVQKSKSRAAILGKPWP